MLEKEQECLEGNTKDKLREFILERTEPCDRKHVCNSKDFKKALKDYLRLPKPAVASVMSDCGYASNGSPNGADRIAVGHHPSRTGKGYGLRLKPQ